MTKIKTNKCTPGGGFYKKISFFLGKNVKECNIFVLLILAFSIISLFGATSYAIFTREISGTGSIKMVVGKTVLGESLNNLIMAQGVVSEGAGLYSSTETNDGKPTYYYKGAVENNYVSFAGFTWRVVRINEDGTVRLIMQDGINNNTGYAFNLTNNEYKYMYYTASNITGGAMKMLEDWYDEHLSAYDTLIATGTYCEQAKVKYSSSATSENAEMKLFSSYTPDFRCKEDDGNGYGIVNSKVGLISIDEVLHAGGNFSEENDYYLVNGNKFWTMSPSGLAVRFTLAWDVGNAGKVASSFVTVYNPLRPLISLETDTLVSGSGKAGDMWIVQS